MKMNRILLAGAAVSALLIGAGVGRCAGRDRQGRKHVHADGRQRRRRRHACPPDRRGRGSRGARGRPEGAVLGVGAGDHDQPVQGRGRGQADLHRDHGPSRRHRLPRSRQERRRPGYHRHRRQFADDRPSGRIRHEGHGLCRRRPLCRRHPDRRRAMLAQGLKSGDEAMVYGVVQPGRARPVGKGSLRHAREGRPQGRPA